MLQMERIDLQCNWDLNVKLRAAKGKPGMTGQFMRELPPFFPEVFSRIMCLFGSIYLCEKLFSMMNFDK